MKKIKKDTDSKKSLEGTAKLQENLRENLGKKTGVTVMGCYMILEVFCGFPEKDHRGK